MIRLLPMLLTAGIFLAVLMTLTRWYRDSEMIIWLSSGFSIKALLKPVLLFCLPIVTIILMLSLFITPWALHKIGEFKSQVESRDELAAISPGVFKELNDGEHIVFIESFDKLGKIVKNVFVQSSQHNKLGIIVASEGHRHRAENKDDFLVMVDGRRYEGNPNTPEYSVTTFDEYAIRIEPNEVIKKAPSVESKSNLELLKDHRGSSAAELQWRFALPITALILAILAIPLSAIDPRAGKIANVILAIGIFLVYNNLLSIAQAWIAKGQISTIIGLWPIHLLFFLIALYFFQRVLQQKPLLPSFNSKKPPISDNIKKTTPIK